MKISMIGCTGKMGKAIMDLIVADKGLTLAAGATHPKSKNIGEAIARTTLKVSGDIGKALNACDVAIDFTRPEMSITTLKQAVKAKRPMVIGTTGFSSAELKEIEKAAKQIPIILAPNTSVGVNLLLGLAKQAASVLGVEYDIEIVEMHHKHKVDAPSGTALALGRAVADGRKVSLDKAAVMSREGNTGARKQGTIGFATLRGGDVVGDHTVMFAGDGERVELTHKASNRAVFAKGAVAAACWLKGKKPGLYTMQDVLFR